MFLPVPKRSLCTWLLALSVMALFERQAEAQGLPTMLGNNRAEAPSSAPADELNRTNPRDAIYNLLEACHANRLVRAAEYLDLSKIPERQRAIQGPELARTTCELLDRNPHFEVRNLTNDTYGHRYDGLAEGLDRLATFDDNGKSVPLLLQQKQQDGKKIWLVSADSVLRIPELAAHAEESPIEKRMPAFLVDHKLIGSPLWVWIALILLALIISVLSRALAKLVVAVLGPLLGKYAPSVQSYHLQALIEPLRVLVSVLVFRASLEFLTPSALLRVYLLNLVLLAFVGSCVSLAMRIVDVLSDRITSRLDARQRAVSYSVVLLGARCVKVLIFCSGALLVLQDWGYPMTTVLAGLGVGGLAVALAAQKTIENLFGGVSVISDRPVLVGDFCQFGGQVGTVEDIGLRSTRIRTLDRTVVTVPNSQFSSMTLENYSRRDRMWFHPAFQLRRDSSAEQIRSMMAAIEQILRDHPKVDPTSVPTRFTKIGSEGFQVEIFAYVLTPDSDEFLKVQTSLLLQILEKAEELGVRFAIPLQESILNPDGLKGTGAGADQIVGERAKNGGGHELDTPLAIGPSAR